MAASVLAAFVPNFPGPAGASNFLLLAGGSSLILGIPYPQPCFGLVFHPRRNK